MKKAPCTPKTLNSRKLCFRQGKGKQYLLSHNFPKPRPAQLRGYSGQPSHARATLRGTALAQRQTPHWVPSLLVGAPTNKSCRNKRRQGAATSPLFTKRTIPLMGCWGSKGKGHVPFWQGLSLPKQTAPNPLACFLCERFFARAKKCEKYRPLQKQALCNFHKHHFQVLERGFGGKLLLRSFHPKKQKNNVPPRRK